MPNTQQTNTALLVFSLSAETEKHRKVLLGKGLVGVNGQVFQWLINRTTSIAAASGLDVHWMDESRQQGQTFGERFTQAFLHLFDKGYERVIAIGNDSPDLSVELLQHAALALQDNTLVLGPALDGGNYLIGIKREDFKVQDFLALPWNTRRLHAAYLALAHQKAWQVVCLKALADLDGRQSLTKYLKLHRRSPLANLIRSLLLINSSEFDQKDLFFQDLREHSGNPLRAPPLNAFPTLL